MKVIYEVNVMLNVNEMKMSKVIKCYFVLCEFLKRVKRSIKMQFKGLVSLTFVSIDIYKSWSKRSLV